MEDISDKDHLGFAELDKIRNKIIKDEKLLFSSKIMKMNHYGMHQERNIIITDNSIYNLKKFGK